MSVLLADKEIGEVFVKEDWACLEECDVRLIAKAQLKKVVKWLRERNDFNVKNIGTGSGLLLTIANWQELLKECE